MTPSFLQLDKYVFKKIHLEAFDVPDPERWIIDTQVEVHQHKENKAVWLVELKVNLKGEGEQTPYKGEFDIAGYFRIVEELNDVAAQNLLNVNGPAVLYSAIREMVFTLTARGPHQPVLLRTVTFIDRKIEPQKDAQTKEQNATDMKTI